MTRYLRILQRLLQSSMLVMIAVYMPLAVLLAPTQAYAISQNDIQSLVNNTPFYDPDAVGCADSGASTSLNGSDNQEKAFHYLVSKGMTAVGAAAIIGNLAEESFGVNPRIVQAYGSHPTTYSDTIPDWAIGHSGYGIAQWTSAGRQQGLIDAATKAGKAQGDLSVQLDYLWTEATTTYKSTLDKIKSATNISDATKAWMLGFESPDPAQARFDIRLQDAQAVLAQPYAKNGTAGAGSCVSTDFATNFIVYKQCDWYSDYSSTQAERNAARAWSGSPYGNSTVCDAGCGPSAMAMIITNMTGQIVTPDMTALYGFQHGTAAGGGKDGSFGDLLGPVIGGHWGLKSEAIPDFNIDQINQTLRNGGLVLAGGHEDNDYDMQQANPPGPFSVGGHFVVIRAITSDGKWLIGNSGGWPDDAKYDPVWVLSHTTVHNAWAITKG